MLPITSVATLITPPAIDASHRSSVFDIYAHRVAISFKAIPYLFHLTRRNNFHFTRPDIYVQLFFRVDLEIFNDKFVWKCIEERIGRRNKGIRRAEGKFCKENSSNKTIRYKNYCLSLNRLNLKIDLIIYSTV